ncbi:MAG TPA: CPBP family intramembrane glutamic endopeptidase [Terracidiphilus sp.]|nr:CPBP family intramembrane glutamic endopeptidase [Terracidiphilus sp.]
MTALHHPIDHLIFAVLLLFPVVELRWTWPRYLARLAAGVPDARLNFYSSLLLEEWIATVVLLRYWTWEHRPLQWLLLIPASPVRFAVGMAVAVALCGLLVLQDKAILARPDVMPKVRKKLAYGEPLLPHTSAERRRFRAVSFTAGVCEETLFRGFLLWYFAVWVGVWPAAILSSIVFGLGHTYLGVRQIPNTALIGMAMAALAILSGSLWPAMLLHAAIDWNSGEIGFKVLNAPESTAT